MSTSGEDKGSGTTSDSTTSDSTTPEKKTETRRGRRGAAKAKQSRSTVQTVRSGLASAVWLLAVLAALVLAVGALLVALGFNADHPLVDFVIETALKIDLGELKAFEGSGDDVRTKWVLVNWGIASLAYLVVGKVLDRLIRP